jgi:DNA-binding transcriptional LysR family regulator
MFRKYQYLLALARQRHFGRAAAECNVAQPTLSNAIRHLEEELGVMIVERGQSFRGFTPEGHKVIETARRVLQEQESLRQELQSEHPELPGELRIGAIPTALPAVSHLVTPFSQRFPHVRVSIISLSSREIQRGLDEFELDAGITYLDNEPLIHVRMQPLYSERYFLLARRNDALAGRESISWGEAADHPLCLLTPDMQNRRIAEAAFRMADRQVVPAIETNSLMNLYTHARTGPWASVVPSQLLTLMPPTPEMVALPLVGPEVTYVVGLVYANRQPPVPLARALATVAVEEHLTAPEPAAGL